jgi:hypothetical protein
MDPDLMFRMFALDPEAEILTLEPAPHTRAVLAIDVTELALEIGFLAGDYAVADYEGEGCQCQQQPEAVEGNGQADEPQHHAEINGIAREAVRAGIDDGRARQAGGYIRAGPGHGHDRPGEQRQRKGKHQRSQTACRYRGRNAGLALNWLLPLPFTRRFAAGWSRNSLGAMDSVSNPAAATYRASCQV